MKLDDIARRIGADLSVSGDVEVRGVCAIDDIREGCLTYAEKRADMERLAGEIRPAAVICGPDVPSGEIPLLRVGNPKLAFAMALSLFHPPDVPAPGVHPSAVVADDARLGDRVAVGPLCSVGRGVEIGDDTVLHAGTAIADDVHIGSGCLFHANVSVYRGSRIGNRVILHSGVVVGSDGFGFVRVEDGRHIKIPQVGNVIMEDDVEMGANSSVDRATLGSTVIGAGTKIDNLVQIGHNVRLGHNVVLCGEVGLSGSVTIGDNTILAGQVGVADHIRIGSNCILGGKAGVVRDIPDGSFYSGFPAQPHRQNMRIMSILKKLPEIVETLRRLEQEHATQDE